jgi:hypothetical protein
LFSLGGGCGKVAIYFHGRPIVFILGLY